MDVQLSQNQQDVQRLISKKKLLIKDHKIKVQASKNEYSRIQTNNSGTLFNKYNQ